MQIDVFNGDADGICALVQLRLAEPTHSTLITGVKRDIELLQQVQAQVGDFITVLDISLVKNRSALDKVLQQGAAVFYVDHHQAGDIPEHQNLRTLIDTDPNTCTSLLVNQYLKGQFATWAVTAAFGDNLLQSAEKLAQNLDLSALQAQQLNDLGVCINYNGYGSQLSDLHFAPDALYRELAPYASPFDFMRDNRLTYEKLLDAYRDDMRLAQAIKPDYETAQVALFILPDEPWARRVSGVFGNELANLHPNRAHAVFSVTEKNDYQVSVRAPLSNKTGADELCSGFATGGGRKSAAGINHLPFEQLSVFITAFTAQYR
ncbi:MAG: DHH family phosphoesterase [Methylococcaceae bacterium]